MPSHLVEVLFQGVWSSMTGGWFYDTHLSLFINTVHMYTWFFLFALPFVFYIVFPSNLLTWSAYTLIISVLFTVIKLVNHQLNKMFDSNKIITSEKIIKQPKRRKRTKQKQQATTSLADDYTQQLLVSESPAELAGTRSKRVRISSKRHRNQPRTTLIDETVVDSDNISFGTNNSICIDYTLGSGSIKSRRSKSYLESSAGPYAKTRHRNGQKSESKSHVPMTSSQAEEEALLDNIDGLLNETSFNEEVNDEESKSYHSKGSRGKKKKLKSCPTEVRSEGYFRSLSSPSKIMSDNKKSDNADYELADYLMIDLDYATNKTSKKASNLSDPNMIAFTASLNQNLEDMSNRSLFKISEESINNLANNTTNNYMYISSKSANELKSKVSKATVSIDLQSCAQRFGLQHAKSNKQRIYSTIDSPKLAKKQLERRNMSNHPEYQIEDSDQRSQAQLSASGSSLDQPDIYSKSQKNSDNYYDIATTPKDTWDTIPSINLTKQTRQSFKLIRRSQSDITLNLFEKLIKKHQLPSIPSDNRNSSSIGEDISHPETKSNNEMSACDKSHFKGIELVKYKFDSEHLAKKIGQVLSQSNCSRIDACEFLTAQEDYSSDKSFDPSWKRLGAKSFPNLLVLPIDECNVNSSSKNGQSEEEFIEQNDERTVSGGLLLSSFSQQLHYEYLKPFRSTLECAQMLRRKKKLSNSGVDNSCTGSSGKQAFLDKDEINIAQIREQFLSLQRQLDKDLEQMRRTKTNSLEAKQLGDIRKKLNELTESTQHMPSLPLAPPPSVPPTEFGDEVDQKHGTGKQKPKSRPFFSKGSKNLQGINASAGSQQITGENELNVQKSNQVPDNVTECIENMPAVVTKSGAPKHISYFSSDLTLTDEERLKLVCDDWDKNENLYGIQDVLKLDSKQSTHQQPSRQHQNQIPWSSPMPLPRGLLPTSRNLTTSASQAASAAVRFFDRLTNRGPNRGVYRLDSETPTLAGHYQKNPMNSKQEASRLLDPTGASDMNFNEYESFEPSEQMDTSSSEEKNLFRAAPRRRSHQQRQRDINIDDATDTDSCSEVANKSKADLNDDYYEEIDENFYDQKSADALYANDSVLSKSIAAGNKKVYQSKLGRQSQASVTKLSKIRTVPMRYDFNSKIGTQSEQPNDSLNNLDFSIDTENLANLKSEPKVLKKNTEALDEISKAGVEDEEKVLKSAENISNRTYEEIMQVDSRCLYYSEIDSARTSKHNRIRTEYSKSYRVSNLSGQPANAGHHRRNRSSSGSNKSSRRSINGTGNAGQRRNVPASAMVTLDSASMFSNDDGISNTSAHNQGTASIYGIRLGRYTRRDRLSSRLRQMNRFDRHSFDRHSFISRNNSSRANQHATTSYQMTSLNADLNLSSSNADNQHDIITLLPQDCDTSQPNSTSNNKSKDSELQDLTRKIYKWELTNSITLNIPFDHYSLLAMLDRNANACELLLSIIISTLVSVLASLILNEQIYDDLLLIIFCTIVASCHYSLLKSVQPDSSSPIHGFNSLTALSRPIYFCIMSAAILALRFTITSSNSVIFAAYLDKLSLYGFRLTFAHFKSLLELFEVLMLFFPIVFTLGLLPQISTYLLCLIEQCDMYLFGGTAMNNLPGAFLSIFRSLSAILSLSGILMGALYSAPSVMNAMERKLDTTTFSPAKLAAETGQFSQSVVFSVFCALLTLFSYFMSRQTSQLLIIIEAVKEFFMDVFSNCRKSEMSLRSSRESFTAAPGAATEAERSDLLLQAEKSKTLENKSSASINIESDVASDDAKSTGKECQSLVTKTDNSTSKGVYLSVPDTSPISSNESLVSVSSFSSSAANAEPTGILPSKNQKQGGESNGTNARDEKLTMPENSQETTDSLPSKATGTNESRSESEIDFSEDILEKKNKKIIRERLESDCLTAVFIFLAAFAVHVSTVFTSLNPILNDVLFCLAISVGALNHYILPQLRVERPWYLFSQPILKPDHWSVFEPSSLAKLVWFEYAYVGLTFLEKNCLNVLVVFSAVTLSADKILLKFAPLDPSGFVACTLISMCSVKLMRHSFCEPAKQYQIFFIAYLFHKFDSNVHSFFPDAETLLFDLFVISIILAKLQDFLEKLAFIYIYTAPWQLPWGSAFHAFAQPLSVPHSALLILQVIVSSLLNAPLMPLMGSAIFLMSYMRPVKFWEKNYRTKRMDNSNTRLNTQFEATTADSENLNGIFYEHLTSVLQDSLAGDLMLGRWGNVSHGDFFILSSDYLNCLVHIIEIGNGFVTFQLRGLEFKGTYCQQRELEAITEDKIEDEGCCCFSMGHLKYMLSFNVAFNLRWVAWSVIAKKYIVNAYRIVENDLSFIVNFYSLRKTLIEFYLKSAIYYVIKSPKLIEWLENANILKELEKYGEDYIDYDVCFDSNLDCDFDTQFKGVTFTKFSANYSKWINFCRHAAISENATSEKPNSTVQQQQPADTTKESLEKLLKDESPNSLVLRFCFALSLLCRRALNNACTGASKSTKYDLIEGSGNGGDSTADSNRQQTSAQASNSMPALDNSLGGNASHCVHAFMDSDTLGSFQHGYYTLFKGDVRIQSAKDEWVFNDMDILKQIIIPSVRMGLRLHQDHFQNDCNDETTLYENLTKFVHETVISYERDPMWRYAVLNSVQSLLSLRHQFTEYSDQYKVVMLNKNFLSFRLIKINKECVRSFWAGQQHELIFLRNKNQERGSIQNAKQVLRNIINSSCDQPIGYPIYVSPLTTSYSSTHTQISKIIGSEFKLRGVFDFLVSCFRRMRDNCTNDCSGSADTNLFQSERNNNRQNMNVTFASKTDSVNLNIHSFINQTGQTKLDSEPKLVQTKQQQQQAMLNAKRLKHENEILRSKTSNESPTSPKQQQQQESTSKKNLCTENPEI